MLITFEAAVLSELQEADARRARVGWFVQSMDVNGASTRYRCFHFARILSTQFDHLYFTSSAELLSALQTLDVVIVVKRLDRSVLDIVASAQTLGRPVFLDLCDDLIADRYAKNELGVNLLHFMGIAPFLAGVTVPSAEMADRIEGYAATNGLPGLQVHVVPDIAETWDIYRATFETITGEKLQPLSTKADLGAGGRAKQIIWFGNYGASHSNFGMFSLRTYFKALRKVNADIPLELVVVSNNEAVYRALVHDCGFATRYVPWSAQAVYSELRSSDAAFLTTGDDAFCSIKSSNRALQALAMGVPVITAKSSALAEFDDAIFSGSVEEALRLCLGPRRSFEVPPRLEAARRVLPRYSPQRIGSIWASLLNGAIQNRSQRRSESSGNILIVIEPGNSPVAAQKLFALTRKLQGVEFEVLVSTDVLEKQAEFQPLLAKAPGVPRFFSGKLKGARNLLLGRRALVVERTDTPAAKELVGFALQLGVATISSSDALNGALESFERKRKHRPPTSKIRAGPFKERMNPDGTVDWAFIVHENARDWILDAICREIGSRQPASWQVFYYPNVSAPAKNLFFSHYMLLLNYLERFPDSLENSKTFVWYTHPREENPAIVARLLLAFDHVTKVVFANEANRQTWIDRGLAEEKTAVVLGAADPQLFRFHKRRGGVVGLSSSFYERKNPDCLVEVMKLLPNRQFVLLGRKWNQYALFEEMKALPNFTYKIAPYSDYPRIYETFDVFLSMSSLEGGPIPLIEAMMSNAVPVASRTGFAPDLIENGKNGFIFDLDSSPETIAGLIESAFALGANVRETVQHYDWENFSAEIVRLAE